LFLLQVSVISLLLFQDFPVFRFQKFNYDGGLVWNFFRLNLFRVFLTFLNL
jgi:hypothetical protein